MGGGLMQLVAYGAQDIYLTGNPQITFFKVVYRRHTNFSIEAIQQVFNQNSENINTGGRKSLLISRNGDLVYKMWLECKLQCGENFFGGSPTYVNWTNNTGHALIEECSIKIGGQQMDKHSSRWLDIWNELTDHEESEWLGLNKHSAKNAYLKSNSSLPLYNKNTLKLYIPLQFWFNRNVGLALPLIALQYHEVNFKITYGSSIGFTRSPKVWIDYIYLDTDERRRFAQVSHEYLIEQVQRDTFAGDKTTFNLKFNHPVKELIFVNDTSGSTETGTTFGPIRCSENVINKEAATPYADADNTSMRLVLNGHDRFAKRKMKYFKTCQPLQHHTRCPSVGKRFTVSVIASVKDLADTTKGIPLYYVTKPVRLISANYAIIVADSANKTMGLYSSDGGTDTDLFDTSSSAKLLTNTPSGGAVHGTNGDFILVKPDNVVCIPAGKVIGLKSAATAVTLEAVITMEFEELPLLIGGIISEDVGNIYCYSFALKPEEHQPSGTCNFSRIDSAQLIFDDAPGGSANCSLKVFAVNYNVLRIMSGMGGLAYSN